MLITLVIQPQKILEGKTPSIKTDLFSLACVLFELYTGELPFKDSSIELKDKPLSSQSLRKIPFLQRSWFINIFNYNPDLRVKSLPLSIFLKLHFLKCKNI